MITREICVRFVRDNGDISDQWFDLDEYYDLEALQEELSNQSTSGDYQLVDYANLGIPTSMRPDIQGLWEAYELINKDPYAEDIIAYCGQIDESREVIENGYGIYDTKEQWAYEYAEECLELKGVALQYFDAESYARDCELSGDVAFIPCSEGVIVCIG